MEELMPVLEEKERSASYKPVFVTEITDDLHFYVQDVETGERTPGPFPPPHSSWRRAGPPPGPQASRGLPAQLAAAAHLPGP